MQCGNNLKQIGLAIHNYHDTYREFPPGAVHANKLGWGVGILPYLEQAALRDQINTNIPWQPGVEIWNSATGQIANLTPHWAETALPAFICPSDPGTTRAHTWWNGTKRAANDTQLAKANYAGVMEARSDRVRLPAAQLNTPVTQWGILRFERGTTEGIRFSDVTDGTSNTAMAGERDTRPAQPAINFPGHRAGIWAGSWKNELYANTGIMSNVQPFRNGARIPGFLINGVETSAFSSFHPGGCHFVFGDGRVQFVSQNIDEYVYVGLGSMQGGEVAGEY
jgi:prepilin-type processing-associated H-X9-DG protein